MAGVITTVIEILREHSPRTTEELAEELGQRSPHLKNPRAAMTNAGLGYQDSVLADGSGKNLRYYFLPTRVSGATVRFSVPAEAPKDNRIVVGAEVARLLRPGERQDKTGPRISLGHGPNISIMSLDWGMRSIVDAIPFPPTFWSWWSEQAAEGCDALELTCINGVHGRFAAKPVKSAELDIPAIAKRDAELREATEKVIAKGTPDGTWWHQIAGRLLARGVFHDPVAPRPLHQLLFDPPTVFVHESMGVSYCGKFTPALRRTFDERFRVPLDVTRAWSLEAHSFSLALRKLDAPESEDGWEDADEVEDDQEAEVDSRIRSGIRGPAEGEGAQRLQLNLQWYPDVWRVVDILDDQTLHDLHHAIQTAFGWDDDHMYKFNLIGLKGPDIADVSMPYSRWGNPDYDPPTSNEIRIGTIELTLKQQLGYVFDFGDNWQVTISTMSAIDPELNVEYPAIIERHGEAPPQYPNYGWNGDDDESGED